MQGTVDGFSYGLVTPIAAFLMACLGGALGLRCTTRSLGRTGSWKPGWLALGAASIGCGIWTMHFIAMTGFSIEEVSISYDVPLTLLSLLVAIVVVGIGVFIVGYRGTGRVPLSCAGVLTGLGVAGMHYIGMWSMRMHGEFRYDPLLVGLSVVIAVVAATAALWAAVTIRGFRASLGASVIMGVAVTGMHYTGMSAMSVHLHSGEAGAGAASLSSVLLPMLLGPLVFLLLASVVVMFDPLLVAGEDRDPVVRAPRPVPSPALDAFTQQYASPAAPGGPAAPGPQRTSGLADDFDFGFPDRSGLPGDPGLGAPGFGGPGGAPRSTGSGDPRLGSYHSGSLAPDAPAHGPGTHGGAAHGVPAHGAPAQGGPAQGAGAHGVPAHGGHAHGGPSHGVPAHGGPAQGPGVHGAAPHAAAPDDGRAFGSRPPGQA